MAQKKTFYWLKLRTDFFADDGPADFMMSQKDGANYVVIYQLLCLKTINTNGVLANQMGDVYIRYDFDKIQRICKYFSADTVRVALTLFQRLGLVQQEKDGTLVITGLPEMVGKETDWARLKREQRQRLPAPANVDSEVDKGVDIVHPEIEKEFRDLNKENKSKKKTADALFVDFANGNAALLEALNGFAEMRKSINKPMTIKAKQMLLNRLVKFPPEQHIPMLEQSIFNSWQNIYPLKAYPEVKNSSAINDLKALHEMFGEEE